LRSISSRIVKTISEAFSTLVVRRTVKNINEECIRLTGKNIRGSIASMVIDIDNDDSITLTWTQFDSVISVINRCERDV